MKDKAVEGRGKAADHQYRSVDGPAAGLGPCRASGLPSIPKPEAINHFEVGARDREKAAQLDRLLQPPQVDPFDEGLPLAHGHIPGRGLWSGTSRHNGPETL